jgi:hypothetical protein
MRYYITNVVNKISLNKGRIDESTRRDKLEEDIRMKTVFDWRFLQLWLRGVIIKMGCNVV